MCGGTVNGRICSTRRVRGCGSKSSPCGCPGRRCLSGLLNGGKLRANRRLAIGKKGSGARCVISFNCMGRGNLVRRGRCSHCGNEIGLAARLTGGLALAAHLNKIISGQDRPSAPNKVSSTKFGTFSDGTLHFPKL